MTSDLQSISFQELLAVNEGETARWQRWFERQPEAVLELPVSIANAGTVREMVLHIFAVELRHSERLLGRSEVTAYETLPRDSVAALFSVGERARALLRQFLASATDEELRQVIRFETRTAGTITSTKRKLTAHIFFHGVRHWAQLATALREHGYATDWHHDLLLMSEFDG